MRALSRKERVIDASAKPQARSSAVASLACPAALVALGAFLRLWHLRHMEFKADEFRWLDLGIQLLSDRPWATSAPWPQIGERSSGGISIPPLSNWLFAGFWQLTHSALGSTVCVALANVLALPPLYLWARKHFGRQRGLMVLAWTALAPFAVIHSRKLWQIELLFPGLVLLLWAVDWLREARLFWRGLAALVASAVVVTQLHLTGPVLMTAVGAVLAVVLWRDGVFRALKRPTGWQALALAGALGALVFLTVPFVRYLLALPKGALGGAVKNPWPMPEYVTNLANTLVPTELESHFGEHFSEFLSRAGARLFSWATLRRYSFVGAVLTGVPVALLGAYGWVRAPWRVPVLGLAWWLFIGAFTALQLRAYPHHGLILAPLPALLAAGAFDGDGEMPRALAVLRWTHLALLGLLSFAVVQWVAARGGASGDYGVDFATREAQAQALLELLDGARTTAGAGSASGLDCDSVNAEVLWIARKRAPARADDLDARASEYQLCAAWRKRGAQSEYAWRLQPAPHAGLAGTWTASSGFAWDHWPRSGSLRGHGMYGLLFHTEEEDRPWLRVDLGGELELHHVILTNRSGETCYLPAGWTPLGKGGQNDYTAIPATRVSYPGAGQTISRT